MALDITFSIEGQEAVSRRLMINADGVKSFRTPLQTIGTNFLKTFDMNFSSRGAMYGGWAPRKPQFKRGRRVDTWPLLERTGRMRRGFRSDVTATSLTLDNTTGYFKYHQSSARRRSRLPRRVMMKIRQQDAEMIVRSFQAYLVELDRKAGRR